MGVIGNDCQIQRAGLHLLYKRYRVSISFAGYGIDSFRSALISVTAPSQN